MINSLWIEDISFFFACNTGWKLDVSLCALGTKKLMMYLSYSSTGHSIQIRAGDELSRVGHKENTIWCPFSCCAYYGLGKYRASNFNDPIRIFFSKN